MNIDTNFLDEKSSAIHALGNMGLYCSSLMFPKLEVVIKTLSELGFYFHENIRYHVCLTLTQIAFGLLKLNTGKADSDDKYGGDATGYQLDTLFHRRRGLNAISTSCVSVCCIQSKTEKFLNYKKVHCTLETKGSS